MSRSSTPKDFAGRCPRCFFRLEVCLCARIPTVATRTRVLILRHHKEAAKSTNTARLAALALPSSVLKSYGAPGEPFDEGDIASDAWLLFPDPAAPARVGPRPTQLVVVDGSWAQARRMVHRQGALARLPRLSLPSVDPGRVRLRRPPASFGLSTLEAVAFALGELEGEAACAPLLDLYELAVQGVLRTRGRLGTPRTRRR